jgi:ferric-dicitrate binding protein FerR (iron transport regulator)
VIDRVHELIHKHLDQIATEAELAELSRLLIADAEAAQAFARASRTDALLADHHREEGDISQATLGFEKQSARQRWRRRARWLAPLAVAAAVLLAVGFGWLFWPAPAPVELLAGRVLVNGVEAKRVPAAARLQTVGEEAAVIRLLDGSRVELAPAASAVLRGSVGEARQVVELLEGDGTFRVAKAAGAFRVETTAGSITAVGTEFAVAFEPFERPKDPKRPSKPTSRLAVSVTEGIVEVRSAGKLEQLTAGQNRGYSVERPHDLTGRIAVVGKDSKVVTIETGGQQAVYRITPRTRGLRDQRLAVGQSVTVWLEPGSKDAIAWIEIQN